MKSSRSDNRRIVWLSKTAGSRPVGKSPGRKQFKGPPKKFSRNDCQSPARSAIGPAVLGNILAARERRTGSRGSGSGNLPCKRRGDCADECGVPQEEGAHGRFVFSVSKAAPASSD